MIRIEQYYYDELREKGNMVDFAFCDYRNVLKFLPKYRNLIDTANRQGDMDFKMTYLEFDEIYRELMSEPNIREERREQLELYLNGYNQRLIGDMYGISKQAVQMKVATLSKRIAKCYRDKFGIEEKVPL